MIPFLSKQPRLMRYHFYPLGFVPSRGLSLVPACVLVCWIALGWFLAVPTLAACGGTIRFQDKDAKNADLLGSDPRPIIDREPFDRLSFNTGQSYDVFPLDAPPPEQRPKRGKLIFKLLDEPDGTVSYAAPWNAVAEIKSFAEIILETAKALEARGDLGEAYRYYNYLLTHPQFEGKRPDVDRFTILVRDAGTSLMANEYWDALVCFEELKANFPAKRFSLPEDIKTAGGGIEFCFSKILAQKYEQKLYRQIREFLASGIQRHPRELTEMRDQWTKRIQDDALELVDELEAALERQQPVLAQDLFRSMMDIAPDLPQAEQFRSMILQRYPMVIVGVDQLPPVRDTRLIESWAARRTGSLVRSQLMEFQRQDEDGGVYRFAHGRMESTGEEGADFRLRLQNEEEWENIPPTTSAELARLLETAAIEGNDSFHPLWARVLESIEVEDPQTVHVRLRYPFLLPAALLQLPFMPSNLPTSDGPYQVDKVEAERVLYRPNQPNPNFVAKENSSSTSVQRPLLLEREITDATRASDLLLSGSIDVLDRVFPTELMKLQRDPNIQVRRYQIPSVHWLIPNLRNDWVSNPLFRRGLLYGIDRQKLVRQVMTNDQPLDGFEVISGPFPVGITESDPLMYANNFKIRPVPFNKDLGQVFIQMAAAQIYAMNLRKAEMERKAAIARGDISEDDSIVQETPKTKTVIGEDGQEKEVDIEVPLPKPPEMVLVHPKGTQAATICSFVARYWGSIGVKVKLRELPEGQYFPAEDDDDYDFVFVECTMQEPLVDARRIFGQTGLVKTIDASVEQSLDRIDRVRNWQAAGSSLRNLHEKVYNEMTILPLWQVPQYYAYRSNVRNLGFDINSLYQNVEQWRVELGEPAEDSP